MTKTTRLLLQFTYEGEMDTIEVAVLQTASHHAALIPLSASCASDERKGVRLELIKQPKDFLEAVQRKAFRHPVSLERFEVFTGARVQRMCADGSAGVRRDTARSPWSDRKCARRWNDGAAHGDEMLPALSSLSSHFRGGTSAARRPAHASAARLKDHVGQEAAFLDGGHAEVPDLERESTGRMRHRD